jgi:RNA polymerase sigma factor (sigma-70 family)
MIDAEKHVHISDAEIVCKVLGGEIAFFELLIRRSNPYLYKVGRSYGYNHQDVEDLMQEAYISTYKNLSKFENRASFKTWLVKIMINHCNRRLQKASFKNELTNDSTAQEHNIPIYPQYRNTDTMVLNKELAGVIEAALEKIPLDYRIVFSLRELNGLSVIETAKTLNITETNVKVRMNRAKKMLKKQIEGMYMPDEIFEFNLIYCDRIVENVMKKISELNT